MEKINGIDYIVFPSSAMVNSKVVDELFGLYEYIERDSKEQNKKEFLFKFSDIIYFVEQKNQISQTTFLINNRV